MTRPPLLPRQGVRLAARVLPPGSARARYQQEFTAELHTMSGRRQRAYAISVLTHAWSLRSALVADPHVREEIEMHHKPLMCRLHLHHAWCWDTTEDGSRYQLCARCGKERADYPEEGGPNLINRGVPMG